MKQVIQYECPKCGQEYQLSEGVEVINKFGWLPPKDHKFRVCKGCRVDTNEHL